MEIIPLTKQHRKSLIELYRTVTKELRKNGIDQWDWLYPNRFTIGGDIRKGFVYGIVEEGQVIGAVSAMREPKPVPADAAWKDPDGKAWSIHRLAVLPDRQGQGIGGRLLRFGESLIRAEGGTSIRLEVYAGNPGAVAMYDRAGYAPTGHNRYPMRKLMYYCYEKLLG